MPLNAVHRVTKVQMGDVIRYEADEEKIRHEDPMIVIYDVFPRCWDGRDGAPTGARLVYVVPGRAPEGFRWRPNDGAAGCGRNCESCRW